MNRKNSTNLVTLYEKADEAYELLGNILDHYRPKKQITLKSGTKLQNSKKDHFGSIKAIFNGMPNYDCVKSAKIREEEYTHCGEFRLRNATILFDNGMQLNIETLGKRKYFSISEALEIPPQSPIELTIEYEMNKSKILIIEPKNEKSEKLKEIIKEHLSELHYDPSIFSDPDLILSVIHEKGGKKQYSLGTITAEIIYGHHRLHEIPNMTLDEIEMQFYKTEEMINQLYRPAFVEEINNLA